MLHMSLWNQDAILSAHCTAWDIRGVGAECCDACISHLLGTACAMMAGRQLQEQYNYYNLSLPPLVVWSGQSCGEVGQHTLTEHSSSGSIMLAALHTKYTSVSGVWTCVCASCNFMIRADHWSLSPRRGCFLGSTVLPLLLVLCSRTQSNACPRPVVPGWLMQAYCLARPATDR